MCSDPSHFKKAAASFWLEKVILLQANPHFHWCPAAQLLLQDRSRASQAGSKNLLSHLMTLPNMCLSHDLNKRLGKLSFQLHIICHRTRRELSWGKCCYRLTTVTKRPWQRKKAIRGKCCPTTLFLLWEDLSSTKIESGLHGVKVLDGISLTGIQFHELDMSFHEKINPKILRCLHQMQHPKELIKRSKGLEMRSKCHWGENSNLKNPQKIKMAYIFFSNLFF